MGTEEGRVKTVADAKAVLADSLRRPLRFVGWAGDDDLYTRGRVAQVVPGLWSGMHPRLLRALVTRRTAHLSGECPGCGALLSVVERDRGEYRHEGRCPASDERLSRLIRRYWTSDRGGGGGGGGGGRGRRLYDPDPDSSAVQGRELWEVDSGGRRVGVLVVGRAGPVSGDGKAA